MLALSSSATIYFCTKPTDMRKGFDGLLALIQSHLEQDPFAGGLYVFVNRRRDRLKLFCWEGDGAGVYYKRLESGSYQFPTASPDQPSLVLSATDLSLILNGIDLKSVKRRKRYQQTKPEKAEVKR